MKCDDMDCLVLLKDDLIESFKKCTGKPEDQQLTIDDIKLELLDYILNGAGDSLSFAAVYERFMLPLRKYEASKREKNEKITRDAIKLRRSSLDIIARAAGYVDYQNFCNRVCEENPLMEVELDLERTFKKIIEDGDMNEVIIPFCDDAFLERTIINWEGAEIPFGPDPELKLFGILYRRDKSTVIGRHINENLQFPIPDLESRIDRRDRIWKKGWKSRRLDTRGSKLAQSYLKNLNIPSDEINALFAIPGSFQFVLPEIVIRELSIRDIRNVFLGKNKDHRIGTGPYEANIQKKFKFLMIARVFLIKDIQIVISNLDRGIILSDKIRSNGDRSSMKYSKDKKRLIYTWHLSDLTTIAYSAFRFSLKKDKIDGIPDNPYFKWGDPGMDDYCGFTQMVDYPALIKIQP